MVRGQANFGVRFQEAKIAQVKATAALNFQLSLPRARLAVSNGIILIGVAKIEAEWPRKDAEAEVTGEVNWVK